jgi:hypothetical protein
MSVGQKTNKLISKEWNKEKMERERKGKMKLKTEKGSHAINRKIIKKFKS